MTIKEARMQIALGTLGLYRILHHPIKDDKITTSNKRKEKMEHNPPLPSKETLKQEILKDLEIDKHLYLQKWDDIIIYTYKKNKKAPYGVIKFPPLTLVTYSESSSFMNLTYEFFYRSEYDEYSEAINSRYELAQQLCYSAVMELLFDGQIKLTPSINSIEEYNMQLALGVLNKDNIIRLSLKKERV
jgi:hypothetical protein